MNRADLKHGDVLCFKYLGNHQNLVERGIRLIEGSRFVHVGIVQSAFGASCPLAQRCGASGPCHRWCRRPTPTCSGRKATTTG